MIKNYVIGVKLEFGKYYLGFSFFLNLVLYLDNGKGGGWIYLIILSFILYLKM